MYSTRQIKTEEQTWLDSLSQSLQSICFTLVVILHDGTEKSYGAESLDQAMINTVAYLFQSQPAIASIKLCRLGQTVMAFEHPCKAYIENVMAMPVMYPADDVQLELAKAELTIALHKHGCQYTASQLCSETSLRLG